MDTLEVVKADGPDMLELLTHDLASGRIDCVPAKRIWRSGAQGFYNMNEVVIAQEGMPDIARVLQLQPCWLPRILICIEEVDRHI